MRLHSLIRIFVGETARKDEAVYCYMNKFLIRLFLIATLLCGYLLCNAMQVRGDYLGSGTSSGQKNEEQIKPGSGMLKQVAEEPQIPAESALRSASSSHRVATSRLTRLLPTHGGKPNNHTGRWTKGQSFNPLLFPFPQSCYSRQRHRAFAASPRLRYVIALRRLLC